jgi:hypothetical protein
MDLSLGVVIRLRLQLRLSRHAGRSRRQFRIQLRGCGHAPGSGEISFSKGELPGLSVFLREDDGIFHTYSTYQRGLDLLIGTYNYLDLTPLGRQEDDEPNVQHGSATTTNILWHSADSCESRSSTITDTRADGTQRTSHLRLEQYERNFPVGLGLVVGVVLMIGDNLRPQTASLLRGRNAGPHTVRRFPLQCHLDVGIVP